MIEHLADQRVPEPVPRRAGRADVKQPSRGSLIQQPGRSFLADAAHLAQQVVLDRLRRGLRDDRGRGQQRHARLAEPGQPSLQHLPHARWHRQRRRGPPRRDQPGHLVHEERVAAGPGLQVGRRLLGQAGAGNAARQGSDRGRIERRQQHPQHAGRQLREPVADLLRGFVLLVPAGEQQHQRQRGGCLGRRPGDQHRHRVRPVQVLQHDEQRLASGSGGDPLDDRGRHELPADGTRDRAVVLPRQLQADGGQRPAPWPQRRHARRRACAAGDLHPRLPGLPGQPVGQHGLAHPGLAQQQHRPAVAGPRACQRRGQLSLLTVAADDRRADGSGQVHVHTQPHARRTGEPANCHRKLRQHRATLDAGADPPSPPPDAEAQAKRASPSPVPRRSLCRAEPRDRRCMDRRDRSREGKV